MRVFVYKGMQLTVPEPLKMERSGSISARRQSTVVGTTELFGWREVWI